VISLQENGMNLFTFDSNGAISGSTGDLKSPLCGSFSPSKRHPSDDGEHNAKRPVGRTILGVSPRTDPGRNDGGICIAVGAPLAQE
jgi:hypothetical protein